MEIIFEVLYELIIMSSMDIVKGRDFPMALRIGAIMVGVMTNLFILYLLENHVNLRKG